MKLIRSLKVDDTSVRSISAWVDREVVPSFYGKWIQITIEKKRKKRSTQQNRYIWGCLYPAAAQAFRDAGNFGVSNDLVHEFFKDRFLDNGIEAVSPITGEVVKMKSSTAELTTGEAMEYIMEIQQFLAEFFGVVVPDPEQQSEIFQD